MKRKSRQEVGCGHSDCILLVVSKIDIELHEGDSAI